MDAVHAENSSLPCLPRQCISHEWISIEKKTSGLVESTNTKIRMNESNKNIFNTHNQQQRGYVLNILEVTSIL